MRTRDDDRGVSLELITHAMGRERGGPGCRLPEMMPTGKPKRQRDPATGELVDVGARHVNRSTALLVYITLAMDANPDRFAWPSAATIARRTGLSTAAVEHALLALKHAGWIKAVGHRDSGRRTVRYYLESPDRVGTHDDDDLESPDPVGSSQIDLESPDPVAKPPDPVAKPPDPVAESPDRVGSIRKEPVDPRRTAPPFAAKPPADLKRTLRRRTA